MAAPVKDPPATASVEERLAALEEQNRQLAARNAELEARQSTAPAVVQIHQQTGDEQSRVASVPTPDRVKALKYLNEGCPLCHAKVSMYEFPAYVHGVPGLWAWVVFHYRTAHVGATLPDPPDAEDERAFEKPVKIVDDGTWGIGLGQPVTIQYRAYLEHAIADYHRGVRA